MPAMPRAAPGRKRLPLPAPSAIDPPPSLGHSGPHDPRSSDALLGPLAIRLCGAVALAYGASATRSVLAADAGTARMQEIAAAVQEGARAYLNRQYLTIGIVGLVLLVILGALLGIHVAIGFAIGAILSGVAGY